MSNLSSIGLNVTTQEDLRQLLEKAYRKSSPVKVNEGRYAVYSDASGAELWLQFNRDNELIGVNPHFKGISKRSVCLTKPVERDASEDEYNAGQTGEGPKFAVQSFIPVGLFAFDKDNAPATPQAYGVFTGLIREFQRKQNHLTGAEFYWLLVDTLGGAIDVVADIVFFEKEPSINGVLQGQFWLSGQLIKESTVQESKAAKGFFHKIFGR